MGNSGDQTLVESLTHVLPEEQAAKLIDFAADPIGELDPYDLRRYSPMMELNLASIPSLRGQPALRSRIRRDWLALTAYRQWEFRTQGYAGANSFDPTRAREDVEQRGWDCDLLDETLAEGRGLIVMTFHVGPFQLLARDLAVAGYTPHLAVHEYEGVSDAARPDAPKFVELTDQRATLRLAEILSGGGVVMIVADGFTGPGQDLSTRYHSNVEILGLPLRMPNGTLRLAAALGTPVLPLVAPRCGEFPQGRVKHQGLLSPNGKLRGAACEEFVQAGMTAAYDLLCSNIEECPEKYGNLPRLHHFRIPSASREVLAPSEHLAGTSTVRRLISEKARLHFEDEFGVLARIRSAPVWLDTGLRVHSVPHAEHWVVEQLAENGLTLSDLQGLPARDRENILNLVGSLWAKGLLRTSHPESEIAS